MHPNKGDDILADLYSSSMFEGNCMLASLGVVSTTSIDKGLYYVHYTASIVNGLSGGPVIALNRPDMLAGIAIGGEVGGVSSILLRTECPVINRAYDYFVHFHMP
jgi:hypothetical protein